MEFFSSGSPVTTVQVVIHHPNVYIIKQERDPVVTILISFFFLSRWHKERIQSYILSHRHTIQSTGFLNSCRGTRGRADVWLRHCSEKESSDLYRGKVWSHEDDITCDGVPKKSSFYFPRWKTTQTRFAGCWRRFPAPQAPWTDSAPSSSSWIISNTPVVVSCATRRCLGLDTSALGGPAPQRCEVGETFHYNMYI